MNAKGKTSSFFESPTPVQLIASCVVKGTPGAQATPSMNNLSYPFRKPLLIDEIRFTISIPLTSNPTINIGALIYAKFSLGQMYLMRDPVPIASLATFMSLEDEENTLTNAYDEAIITSHYRWRLPYPLYVEAGQYILPVFSRQLDIAPQAGTPVDATVWVTYAGRTVPPHLPRPKVIAVPYAAPFVTPTVRAVSSSNGYFQSNERHLFNPFDKPIQIQRMTGRLYKLNTSDFYSLNLKTGITPGPANVAAVTVRLNDSWGGKMVNNFTGPADVWDIQRTAWTVDTAMPGKGMYEAQIWNVPDAAMVHLAMIGTREETL